MTNGTTNDVRAALEALARRLSWSKVELDHALAAQGTRYKEEAVLCLANGRQIRCPAFPADCAYVRITQAGHELGYWHHQEWADDPCDVMGAVLGCAHGPSVDVIPAPNVTHGEPGAWLGKLRTRIGEYEYTTPVLLVASSSDAAARLLECAAAEFYGDGDEPLEDGGYYANDRQLHTSASSLAPLRGDTFEALKPLGFLLKREPGVVTWREEAEDQVNSVVAAMQSQGIDATHLGEEVLRVAEGRGADVLNGPLEDAVRYLLLAGCEPRRILEIGRRAAEADD